MSNEFPQVWHETFSRTVDPRLTEAEVAFLTRVLPRGRVLDVACGFGRHALWNPAAYAPGERTLRGDVRERKTLAAGRMRTELTYPDGQTDVHDVRLYEPAELERLAAGHGLEPVLLCTWCDESRPPSARDARYQLVLG